MDFYDSLFQYDLEIQNKLTERLNKFFKSINLLKNESLINQSHTTDSKYKHIHYLIDEINASNKFKNKLLLNQKKQLLLRMNNKSKINSKYYIYAKDMNQDNKKMDIIQIENYVTKREQYIEQEHKKEFEFENCFNQQKINYDQNNIKENFTEENNNLCKLKSDINKIVCDIIKQNVKSLYNKKINEKSISKLKINMNKEKKIENNNEGNDRNNKIKNNNYIKIDLPKKEIYFSDIKEGKENKKIHNI